MAKKHHEEEHENHERWLVSYADFITLLFAFFTVLYATAQKDVKKEEEFQKSIRTYFRSFVDFGGLMGKFVGKGDNSSIIPPPIDTVPLEGPGPENKEEITKSSEIEKGLADGLGSEEDTEVKRDQNGVRVTIRSKNFFDSGTALLRRDAIGKLDRIARILKKVRRNIIIEGHTDDRQVKSPQFPSNWELSSARASTIIRYFVEIHGLSPSRFAAVGYADQKPLVANNTEANRAKNRRTDILIVEGPTNPIENPDEVVPTHKDEPPKSEH